MKYLLQLLIALPVVIQAQTNVGIGTITPQSKLDILSTGDGAQLLRFSTERAWVFKQTGSGNGTALALQTLFDGKSFKILSLDGFNRAAEFFANNAGSKTLLVPDGGTVGIGLSSPMAKLHIRHDSGAGSPHLLLTEIGYDFTRIRMENDANPSVSWNIVGLADSSLTDSKINFFYTSPLGAGDRLTITGGGNIGIGTNTPSSKLHILGGNINVDNSGVALKVLGDEAVWYNDTYFSWGLGGAYNYFGDNVKIGGSGGSAPTNMLEVTGPVYASSNVATTFALTGDGISYGSGVHGYSLFYYGIFGETDGASGSAVGVRGIANATSGEAIGVLGRSYSPDGFAGYFVGNVRINGDLLLNEVGPGDYDDLQIDPSTDMLFRDNSSRRFKENIRKLETDFSKILQVTPVQYTRPGRPDRIEIGYIAEDMAALGLNYLVGRDKDGLVESFNYRKMTLYVVEVLKDQNQRLEAQEKLIAEQQAAISTLQK